MASGAAFTLSSLLSSITGLLKDRGDEPRGCFVEPVDGTGALIDKTEHTIVQLAAVTAPPSPASSVASERVGADDHDPDSATKGRLQQLLPLPEEDSAVPLIGGCKSQCPFEGADTQRSSSSAAVKVMTDRRFLARMFAFVGVEGVGGGGGVGWVNRAWQYAVYHAQQQQPPQHGTFHELQQQLSVQLHDLHGAKDTTEVPVLGYSKVKGGSMDTREEADLCVGVEDRYDYVHALPTADTTVVDGFIVRFEVWDEMDGTTLLSAYGTMEFEDACVVGEDDDTDTICTFVSVVSGRAARTGAHADARTQTHTAGTPLCAASRDPVNQRFSSMEDYLCRCHEWGCASSVGMRVSVCSAHTGKVAVLWESSSDVALAVEEPVIGMSKLLKLPPGTRQVYTTQMVPLCAGGGGDNVSGGGAGAVAGADGVHDRDRACGGRGVRMEAGTNQKPMEADIQFYICPLPGQEGVSAQETLWRFWAANACAEEGMSFLNLAVNAELEDVVRHVRSLFV